MSNNEIDKREEKRDTIKAIGLVFILVVNSFVFGYQVSRSLSDEREREIWKIAHDWQQAARECK